jgi:hypothetical protein
VGGERVTALQALSLLSHWQGGRFRIRLRALFGEQAPAEAPIIVEKETSRGNFDVTGTVPIPSLWDEPRTPSRSPARPRAPERPGAEPSVEIHLSPSYEEILKMAEAQKDAAPPAGLSPPSGTSSSSAGAAGSAAAAKSSSSGAARSSAAAKSSSSAGAARSSAAATSVSGAASLGDGPLSPSGRSAGRSPASGRRPAGSPWGRALLLGVAGGVAAFLLIAFFRMGIPWLRGAPRPAVPAAAVGVSSPAGHAAKPPVRAGTLSAVRQEPGALSGNPAPPAPVVPAPPAPVVPAAGPAPETRSREVRALVERAQRLIIEGRTKKAQELVQQAQELTPAPGDPGLLALLRQARGELGRGELVLSGHGSVTINGHKFDAPRKMRVLAGPYLVNGKEVEVRDGEQRHLSP